jgi:hypothetical protein
VRPPPPPPPPPRPAPFRRPAPPAPDRGCAAAAARTLRRSHTHLHARIALLHRTMGGWVALWRARPAAVRRYDPIVIANLQQAARTNAPAAYKRFSELSDEQTRKCSLRGLLEFKPTQPVSAAAPRAVSSPTGTGSRHGSARLCAPVKCAAKGAGPLASACRRLPGDGWAKPRSREHARSFALQVALERVEPARAILKRFCTGAMYAPLCPTPAWAMPPPSELARLCHRPAAQTGRSRGHSGSPAAAAPGLEPKVSAASPGVRSGCSARGVSE